MPRGTVHQEILRGVYRAAVIELGDAAHPLFTPLDLSRRVPLDAALETWNRLADADDDGTLGARLGRHQLIRRGVLGALVDAAGAQPTFAQAMWVLSRYYGLISSSAELGVELCDGSEFHVRSLYGAGFRNRVVAQSTLAVLLCGCREITGAPLPLLRVTFAAPISARACRRLRALYGAPVLPSTGTDSLIFPASFGKTKLPLDSRRQKSIERAEAETRLTVSAASVFLEDVIKEIQLELPTPPKIEAIAAGLAIAPRSLQRRLCDEGTNFREICTRARIDIAHGYLREGGSVTEVAFLVGYSDATAFSRAYRRTKGHSPQADTDRSRKRES